MLENRIEWGRVIAPANIVKHANITGCRLPRARGKPIHVRSDTINKSYETPNEDLRR
jgi:hypothetical protein